MPSARSIPISDETSDEDLVALLAAGRQDVLAPLYARYARLLFDIAARSLDRPAAEEIVQDVFLAVWRRASTFDAEQGPFRPWILQMAHWRVINELRRRSRRPHLDPDADPEWLDSVADVGPEPDDVASRAEQRAAVRDALIRLPAAQRQALGLAFFADLTHQEVASTLGLPLGTAKTRIRTGLRSLRTHLAPLAAAMAFLVALAAGAVHEWQVQTSLARNQRALILVTTSDVVSIRMTAAAGIPETEHGTYRGRPGADIAVVTVSNLPPATAGETYRAWGEFGGRWALLGAVHPDVVGADLLIAEGPELQSPPTALMVTLERGEPATTPTGAVIASGSGP